MLIKILDNNSVPQFVSSQLLTSTSLNGLKDYLDTNIRANRNALNGMGVFQGLEVYYNDGTTPPDPQDQVEAGVPYIKIKGIESCLFMLSVLKKVLQNKILVYFSTKKVPSSQSQKFSRPPLSECVYFPDLKNTMEKNGANFLMAKKGKK